MASLALPLSLGGACLQDDNKNRSKRGVSSCVNLKNQTLVFPSLKQFWVPPPAPLFAPRHQKLQDASTLIRAAWTRRSRGQIPAKKRKSWGQRVDKYMRPFQLDINISRRYLTAKVTHRVTGKVVSVCTTNAKDLRFSLPSLIDANACRTVGTLLAERTKAADIFAVVYDPRRDEKLEGRLGIILDTLLANDIVLV